MHEEIKRLLDKREADQAESTKLHAELKASLAIQRIAPTAFDHGLARIASESRWPHKNKEDFTITIIDGNGAKLVTVVGEAIPDELFASYKNRIIKN